MAREREKQLLDAAKRVYGKKRSLSLEDTLKLNRIMVAQYRLSIVRELTETYGKINNHIDSLMASIKELKLENLRLRQTKKLNHTQRP